MFPRNSNSAMLQKKEKYAFSFALLGQNMIYTFLNLYLMFYFTDILGIAAAAAGMLFLIARIWDAVNDPIMGIIMDRTTSKLGKCRPYLIIAPIPIVLLTISLFVRHDFNPQGTLIYAYIVYIGWGMFYTAYDIPLWSMSSRLTTDSSERKTLISWGRIFTSIGCSLPVFLVVPLKNILGDGDEYLGYLYTIIIFTLAAMPLLLQVFFNTKEKTRNTESAKPTLLENIRAIANNPPLLQLLLSTLLGTFITLPVTAGIYFVTYNLGNDMLMILLAGICLFSSALGAAAAPKLAKMTSSKNVLIGSSLIAAFLFIAAYFIGYSSIVVITILTFVIGFLLGIPLVLRTAMLANTIEVAQSKTGKRSEGIIFSMLTFSGKLKMGISSFAIGIILKVIGYIPEVPQSWESLNGIYLMMTIIPAIGCVLTIFPLFFYNMDDKQHKELVDKI